MYRSLVQCDINFGQTKAEEMKLIDFISKFPDEESCKTKLREYRERHGVVCPRCGSIQHYWKRVIGNFASAKFGKVKSAVN